MALNGSYPAMLHPSLLVLFDEVVHGAPNKYAFILNSGDPGLLGSLQRLSAAEASAVSPQGGATIAAHVDHLRYGLELMNRWVDGEPNPFATADWSKSWERNTVNDAEWTERLAALRNEATRWRKALESPRELSPIEANGVLGSVVHLAYHLGAIRQINRTARGPADPGLSAA